MRGKKRVEYEIVYGRWVRSTHYQPVSRDELDWGGKRRREGRKGNDPCSTLQDSQCKNECALSLGRFALDRRLVGLGRVWEGERPGEGIRPLRIDRPCEKGILPIEEFPRNPQRSSYSMRFLPSSSSQSTWLREKREVWVWLSGGRGREGREWDSARGKGRNPRFRPWTSSSTETDHSFPPFEIMRQMRRSSSFHSWESARSKYFFDSDFPLQYRLFLIVIPACSFFEMGKEWKILRKKFLHDFSSCFCVYHWSLCLTHSFNSLLPRQHLSFLPFIVSIHSLHSWHSSSQTVAR